VGHLGSDLQPVGADGYPKRLWDKKTGVIDKTVAESWKKYDLREILEKNWTKLGPTLAPKLNVYIGDMDSYYLNMGVRMLDEFLKQRAKDPPFAGEIVFQPMAPHCWGRADRSCSARWTPTSTARAGRRGFEELEVLMSILRVSAILCVSACLVMTVQSQRRV
jgi:hypothetical protein